MSCCNGSYVQSDFCSEFDTAFGEPATVTSVETYHLPADYYVTPGGALAVNAVLRTRTVTHLAPREPQPCPTCGRCPTCGYGGPWYHDPYPSYPIWHASDSTTNRWTVSNVGY